MDLEVVKDKVKQRLRRDKGKGERWLKGKKQNKTIHSGLDLLQPYLY